MYSMADLKYDWAERGRSVVEMDLEVLDQNSQWLFDGFRNYHFVIIKEGSTKYHFFREEITEKNFMGQYYKAYFAGRSYFFEKKAYKTKDDILFWVKNRIERHKKKNEI